MNGEKQLPFATKIYFDKRQSRKRPAAFRTLETINKKSVRSCKFTANIWEHEI